MAWLVDTNILIYRYDLADPVKHRAATSLLREGLRSGEARLSQQTIVEFVAAATRPSRGGGPPLLPAGDARRLADELITEFEILYPTEVQLRLALRGAALYGMAWFDALMWATAEANGLPVLYSEDFQHGRVYGGVQVLNPFLPTP